MILVRDEMDFIQVMLVMEKKGYKIDFGNYKQNS